MEEADKRQRGEEEKEAAEVEVEVGTEGINRLNGETETDGESTQRRQKIGGILDGGAKSCLPVPGATKPKFSSTQTFCPHWGRSKKFLQQLK